MPRKAVAADVVLSKASYDQVIAAGRGIRCVKCSVKDRDQVCVPDLLTASMPPNWRGLCEREPEQLVPAIADFTSGFTSTDDTPDLMHYSMTDNTLLWLLQHPESLTTQRVSGSQGSSQAAG